MMDEIKIDERNQAMIRSIIAQINGLNNQLNIILAAIRNQTEATDDYILSSDGTKLVKNVIKIIEIAVPKEEVL
jgi:hypothetical protein